MKISQLLATLMLAFALCLGSGFTLAAQLPVPAQDGKAQQQRIYRGNVKSKKYHNPECDHYQCRTCTATFKSPEAAKKAGYSPCGKCGG